MNKKYVAVAVLAAALTVPLPKIFAEEITTTKILAAIDGQMSRGSFIEALGNVFNAQPVTASVFTDVEPGQNYAGFIGWGAANGIVQGTGAGKFEPDRAITRQEMAVMIYNAANVAGLDVSNIEGMGIYNFEDYDQISEYALTAIRYCLNAGILAMEPEITSLRPQDAVSLNEVDHTLSLLKEMYEAANQQANYTSELMTVKSFDGYELQGKLNMPANGKADKVVIFVNGSGPNTYDNYRKSGEYEFNYFDLFAKEFTADGTAFFSSSTRGVTPGDTPPLYSDIDEEEYKTYLPQNTVKDNEAIINALKSDDRLKDAKVYLLGWSEGTMIAPAVAIGGNAQVDGLLLAGYANGTMDDAYLWQQTGESSMIFYRQYFDYDGDGKVTEDEFTEDRYGLSEYIGAGFADIDLNKNGEIDKDDFAQMLEPGKIALLDAVQRGDDEWLKANYGVQLTSGWFKAHREFTPNSVTLPKLDIPIHIFHGTYDANVSVQGVYDIASEFEKLGKTNLHTHIFEGADHDLNYTEYMVHGTVPQGIQAIFDACEDME